MPEETLEEMIVKVMMKYRGLMPNRYKASNYIDIDQAGPAVAQEIIEELRKKFELRVKESGVVQWNE